MSSRTVEEFPKGQQQQCPKGAKHHLDAINKRKLFKNPLKSKKARLTPSKLTPVKLLLSSPFSRTKQCKQNMSVPSATSTTTPQNRYPLGPIEKNSMGESTSSENQRLNLESLKEAQIYGLPIIPFPYSEKALLKTSDNAKPTARGRLSGSLCNTYNTTPLNNHFNNHHIDRLMAATDIRPARKMNYRQQYLPSSAMAAPSAINRRLHFDQEGYDAMSR